VFGDISYIEVKPHDEDPFFVTASETGYFINKVHKREGEIILTNCFRTFYQEGSFELHKGFNFPKHI